MQGAAPLPLNPGKLGRRGGGSEIRRLRENTGDSGPFRAARAAVRSVAGATTFCSWDFPARR
eukprot:12355424-Alexandrium_andersonii.AAC.1